jgi:hypothetical protein
MGNIFLRCFSPPAVLGLQAGPELLGGGGGGGGGGGVGGRGVTPQKKVNKGAQLAERGAWNAGIAGRVKYWGVFWKIEVEKGIKN